jgi:hypothetical protein
VRKIKADLRADGRRGAQARIARQYEVNPLAISDIATGKTWKHVV